MRTTVFWDAVGGDFLRRAAALSVLSLLYQQNLSLFQLELVICTQEPQYFAPLLQHERIRFQYVSDSFSIRLAEYGATIVCVNPFTIFRKSIIPAAEQVQERTAVWQTAENRIAFVGFPASAILELASCSPETAHQAIADKNLRWLTNPVTYVYSAEDELANKLIFSMMPAKIPNLHLDQLVAAAFPKVFTQPEHQDFWDRYAQ